MFSLKWNDFQECLGTRVSGLYESDDLTDVSLACEDGTIIKSHKFILSLFSTFFRTIFSENPCKHPIVILKGLKSPEVRRVLSFIYLGHAKMKEWEINEFLQAAESLRIDGINSNNPIINSCDNSSRILRSSDLPQVSSPPLPSTKIDDHGPPKSPPLDCLGDRDRDRDRESSITSCSLPSIGSPHSWPPTTRKSGDYHQFHPVDELRSSGSRSCCVPSQTQTEREEHETSVPNTPTTSTTRLSLLGLDGRDEPVKRSRSSESPTITFNSNTADEQVELSIIEQQSEHFPHDQSPSAEDDARTRDFMYRHRRTPSHEADEVQDLSTYRTEISQTSTTITNIQLPLRKRSWEPEPSYTQTQSSYSQQSTRSSSWPDSHSHSRTTQPRPVKSSNYLPLSVLAAASGAGGPSPSISQTSYSALSTLPLFSPTTSKRAYQSPQVYPPYFTHPLTQHHSQQSQHPIRISASRSSALSIEEQQLRLAAAAAAASGSVPPSTTITSRQHPITSPPSRPRTKAIRSSQVPQSSRYTAAEVDSMVEQVDNFPGPLVPCAICSKFVKRERLRAHIHECHLLQGEKITCPHCFIGLKSKGSYRVHIWRHKRGNLGIKGSIPPNSQQPQQSSQTAQQLPPHLQQQLQQHLRTDPK